MERCAVALVCENNGRFLMGKKKSDSDGTLHGEWHLIGETVEGDEADADAIVRCLLEEVGIQSVEILLMLDSHTTPKGTVVNWYLCRTDVEELFPGSDLVDARWVPRSEVADLSGEVAKSLWPSKIKSLFVSS